MKISRMVSELWSAHEKQMTDRRKGRRKDGGHDIIRPVFDGRIKRTNETATKVPPWKVDNSTCDDNTTKLDTKQNSSK